MRETWYVLVDGNAVCPSEVLLNEAGLIIHKSGVLVAMKGDVPHTKNIDPAEERAMKEQVSKEKGYKTRQIKAK